MRPDHRQLIEQRLLEQYPRFYRLAYSYLKNEADAQDAVQDAACKALRSWNTLKEPKYLDTWLYRIVVNHSVTLLRSRNRWSEDETALETLSVEDHYENTDLLRALDALDETERTIVTLRYFEELKLSEVAEVVQMPLSTVKSRVYRALEKLRDVLKEED